MNILSEIPASIAKHIPIKAAILQAGIASHARDLCKDLGKTLLICDENTKNFVKLDGEIKILPAKQKAELELAKQLSKLNADHFIAVGSGSLNDMVKYAAYIADKPYTVFGTAASMNGYASMSSSLLENGYKKSFAARPPQNIYLDLEILKEAPKRLTNSGIGDSICRSTAHADALLSAQATGTSEYTELFSMLQKHEPRIFDDVESLAKMLIFGGIAMLLAHSSAPASQGEHMLAHYMELMQTDSPLSFHGEQIAVTTLTMAKLQEKLLDEKDYAEVDNPDPRKIIEHFGEKFGAYCLEQTAKKYKNLKRVKIDKASIENVMIRSNILHDKLKAIGAPLNPNDIGWKQDIYDNALQYTKYTRDRFTFLDLV